MSGRPPPRVLLLLRHAKAMASAAGNAGDHARDLAASGRADATALGIEMRRLGLKPELAVISSALRTRRTWEMLGRFDDPAPAVTLTDRLYLAERAALMSAIHEIPDTFASAMLIGHNPGLHELALQLAAEPDLPPALRTEMRTCTLVAFEFPGRWSELVPGGARCLRVLRP